MPEKNYDTNDLPTNSYGVEYDKDMYLANDRYAYFIDKEIEINKKNLKKWKNEKKFDFFLAISEFLIKKTTKYFKNFTTNLLQKIYDEHTKNVLENLTSKWSREWSNLNHKQF